MTKIVGLAEFQANCRELIAEMQATGVSITLTEDGKPVAEIQPAGEKPRSASFGFLKNDAYRFDIDPSEPAGDPMDWDALR